MANYYNKDIHYATLNAVPVAPPPPPNVPSSSQFSDVAGKPVHTIDEEQRKQLLKQGYTNGLISSINEVQNCFPLRIWVVDNSGSMARVDGHQYIPTNNHTDMKIASCTRWVEIQDCVKYHVQLSALIKAPTNFRLLNDPGLGKASQSFDIALKGDAMINSDVNNAMRIMNKVGPSGVTPLTYHIREIYDVIASLKSSLQTEGKRVVVVLATDGLPTNELGTCNDYIKNAFVQSLRSLEGLPVWLVIRLSTDEEEVVDFYNSLDDQLELSMDVLDDFSGEAEEIYEHNKWLNYGLPLHRLREMGFHDRVLDMIDERPLTIGEIRDFCILLFGIEKCDGLPDPSIDWVGFVECIKLLLAEEELQWDPVKKKPMPWINMSQLEKAYGIGRSNDGCACVIM